MVIANVTNGRQRRNEQRRRGAIRKTSSSRFGGTYVVQRKPRPLTQDDGDQRKDVDDVTGPQRNIQTQRKSAIALCTNEDALMETERFTSGIWNSPRVPHGNGSDASHTNNYDRSPSHLTHDVDACNNDTDGDSAIAHHDDDEPNEDEIDDDTFEIQPDGSGPPNEISVCNPPTWAEMVSSLCLISNLNFTVRQYHFLRQTLSHRAPNDKFPTYKTFRSTLWKRLLKRSFPRSQVQLLHKRSHIPNNPSCSMVRDDVSNTLCDPRNCARIVLPSEWAKLDFATYPCYMDIFEHKCKDDIDYLTVLDSNISDPLRTHIRFKNHLWVETRSGHIPAMTGSPLTIPCGKRYTKKDHVALVGQLWPLKTGSSERERILDGSLSGFWIIVGPEGSSLLSEAETFSVKEKEVHDAIASCMQTFKWTNIVQHPLMSSFKTLFYPGDHCAIIRSATNESQRLVCILVSSLVAPFYGGWAETLIWIDVQDVPRSGTSRSRYMSFAAIAKVAGAARWNYDKDDPPQHVHARSPDRGLLADGTPFYIMKYALYADGFKQLKSLSDTRSIGGVYMLPMGLSQKTRASSAAVRAIALTPNGQSENDVLNIIVPDLVCGTTTGIETFHLNGDRCVLFIDPVCFIGDFPAVSGASDAIGHTGDSCCTLCTMRRHKGRDGMPEILCNLTAHGMRTCFCKTDDKVKSIRQGDPPEKLLTFLGLKKFSSDDYRRLPLVKLSASLELSSSNRVKCNTGDPVPIGTFDSFRSAAVAPDHLLTGLIKNVLNVCFKICGNNATRLRIEAQIIDGVVSNGLPWRGHILRWDKSVKTYMGLHSMTMTNLYCVLLVASRVFSFHSLTDSGQVFDLPRLLQTLVAQLYRWPSKEVDGSACVQEYRKNITTDIHKDIMRSATTFLVTCNTIASTFPIGKELDKPNAHRLVELCKVSLPLFGHVRIISELVLEMTHRLFKDWLERTTSHNSHIVAMERALGRDWLSRISTCYGQWVRATGTNKDMLEMSLARLLLGEQGIKSKIHGGDEWSHRFGLQLEDVFQDPVAPELKRTVTTVFSPTSKMYWRPIGKANNSFSRETHIGISKLDALGGLVDPYNSTVFTPYSSIQYSILDEDNNERRSYQFSTVSEGHAIACRVGVQNSAQDFVVPVSADTIGSLVFYVVIRHLVQESGQIWTIAKRLRRAGGTFRIATHKIQLVRMDSSVRRAALIHHCTSLCRVRNGYMVHNETILGGGSYYVIPRHHGYPPPMG